MKRAAGMAMSKLATLTAAEIAALDRTDPLRARRQLFEIPKGLIYLDGNSLGVLSTAARQRAATVVAEEWGQSLITAWNVHGWMDLPKSVGNRIGALIGAEAEHVVVCDTTSVNIFKLLAAALALRPDRKVILCEQSSFPTDLYMAQGYVGFAAGGAALKTVPAAAVTAALDETIAVLLLSDIDYRSGARRDIKAVTRAAHKAGALVIWDLCHSAGAVPVDLKGAKADFAVGCSYKYLNGGPGAPAYLFVAPQHLAAVHQPLSGWLGHAAPFQFEPDFRPAGGIERMITSTPSVIGLAVLDAALDAFDGVDMGQLRAKSLALADLFHARVSARCRSLKLATPLAPEQRGSQLAYHFEHGYAAIQALIAAGVIGDFRTPDLMRFGFTPLYLSYAEVARAADVLADIIATERYREPQFQVRRKVT